MAGQHLVDRIRHALRTMSGFRFGQAKVRAPLDDRIRRSLSGRSVLSFGMAKAGKLLLACVGRALRNISVECGPPYPMPCDTFPAAYPFCALGWPRQAIGWWTAFNARPGKCPFAVWPGICRSAICEPNSTRAQDHVRFSLLPGKGKATIWGPHLTLP